MSYNIQHFAFSVFIVPTGSVQSAGTGSKLITKISFLQGLKIYDPAYFTGIGRSLKGIIKKRNIMPINYHYANRQQKQQYYLLNHGLWKIYSEDGV